MVACLFSTNHFYFLCCADLHGFSLATLSLVTLHYYRQVASSFAVGSVAKSCLFATPRTAARQASLSSTISQSLLKFMSPESVMPSNHLILCWPFSSCPQSFPESGPFPMSQLLASGGQSIGTLASASVLPMNIQGWFSLGWTGLISLQSKGL